MNRYNAFVQPVYPIGERIGKVGRQYPANTRAIERPSGEYACPARGPGEWSLNALVTWAGENQSSLVIFQLDPQGQFSEHDAYNAHVGGL
jgi:hypothetical protein